MTIDKFYKLNILFHSLKFAAMYSNIKHGISIITQTKQKVAYSATLCFYSFFCRISSRTAGRGTMFLIASTKGFEANGSSP